MAQQVLTDCGIYIHGFDLSGDSNALALEYAAEMLDSTAFGDDTRVRAGGLKVVTANARGFWNSSDATTGDWDTGIFDRVGTAAIPTTLSVDDTVGNRAYLFQATGATYDIGGEIGVLLPYSLDLEASGDLVRGSFMIDASAVTSSANGTAVQVGEVAAGETMYAALHVLAASGTNPTLDVTIESDDASGMGTPTTQITFAQATGVTSEWASVAGAIANDDWWRVAYTIGGTDTPTFSFAVSIGIL